MITIQLNKKYLKYTLLPYAADLMDSGSEIVEYCDC